MKSGVRIIGIVLGLNERVAAKASRKKMKRLTTIVELSGDDMVWLAEGRLRGHISTSFSLEQMAKAHSLLESGHMAG